VDRDGGDILDALHAKPKTMHRVVLHGMPAVGKTQAALEYSYRFSEDRQYYREVFWTIAETEDQLRAGLLGVATRLGLPTDRPVLETLNAVKAELEKREGWLWVLDNALNVRIVTSYLPAPRSGRVLITTARPESELHVLNALAVELTHFHSSAEGAHFLLNLAGLLDRDQAVEEIHADDVVAAKSFTDGKVPRPFGFWIIASKVPIPVYERAERGAAPSTIRAALATVVPIGWILGYGTKVV
jgi:hypothetical protein